MRSAATTAALRSRNTVQPVKVAVVRELMLYRSRRLHRGHSCVEGCSHGEDTSTFNECTKGDVSTLVLSRAVAAVVEPAAILVRLAAIVPPVRQRTRRSYAAGWNHYWAHGSQ